MEITFQSISPVKILVVDDDQDILELLRYNLTREGYQVNLASDGEQALKSVQWETPDLILLDLMLPKLSGLDVARHLQENRYTKSIPIIMLTAKGEESDIVIGLELGAADYIVKPFSIRVLLARIRAVLRRYTQQSEDKTNLKVEGIEMIPDRFEVYVDGKRVEMTVTEYKILENFIRWQGKIFTREQIINAIHKDGHFVTDRSVDVHITTLRKKLGPYANLIETIRGIGYRLKD